jgi:hypothetical protein
MSPCYLSLNQIEPERTTTSVAGYIADLIVILSTQRLRPSSMEK